MDPRMFKLFGYTMMMKADDTAGGGGDADDIEIETGDNDDEGDEDDDEDDPDDEGDEDGDEDGDDAGDEDDPDDEGDEDGDEDDPDDEGDENDLGNLSQRTQKRIKKLVAEKKDLQRQLNEAQKLGGSDGEAIISAAENAGIMPSLMTKELASGLNELAEKKSALKYFQNLLDSDEDEFEIGEKTYTRRQIERKEKTLTEEVRTAEAKLGPGRDKAIADAKELFALGLAAKKAGWKPGKSAKTKKTKLDGPKHKANVRHKKAAVRKGVNPDDVVDDDSLEAFIAAERRKKGI